MVGLGVLPENQVSLRDASLDNHAAGLSFPVSQLDRVTSLKRYSCNAVWGIFLNRKTVQQNGFLLDGWLGLVPGYFEVIN